MFVNHPEDFFGKKKKTKQTIHAKTFCLLTEMHNLSISCAMVCVILLASAALLGAFGIIKRQISAVLITGVMYILAGIVIFK